jgi:exodeoxyribonuclease VIII
MPGDEYHGGPEVSYSGLKKVDRSPGFYHWNLTHPKPASPQMDKGSATDCLLSRGEEGFERKYVTPPLTPDDLPDWCVLAPSSMRKADKEAREEIRQSGKVPIKESAFDLTGLKLTTKCGKAWRDRESRKVITHKELHEIQECVAAIRRYPHAAELLDGATFQASMFWEDPEFGVRLRGRPDIMGPQGITDLKTTADVRFFAKQIDSFSYHWQAAMYLDGAEACGWDGPLEWRWIVAEPEPPYAVEVSHPVSLSLLELGRDEYRRALKTYAQCKEADTWPASSYGLMEFDLPNWRYER